MRDRFFRQRPLLSVPQVLLLLTFVGILFIGLDLNRRSQAGRAVGVGEEALRQEVMVESTRQVELEATLTYVQSEDYVASYARNEGGQLLPGEKRVVPLLIEATPEATPPAAPTPDPALSARPWQAWWRLLTDAPLPSQ